MRLGKRYSFDWDRIQCEDPYHIEYSITDICNRNCGCCSHLAPLAKRPNFVSAEEFAEKTEILHGLIPDAHTFWLTGGEPTLHPRFMRLAEIARNIFADNHVGIYTNGMTLERYENDEAFWRFTKDNGIVWAVTFYDRDRAYFESMFERHGCLDNLALLHGGRRFFKLVNYSRDRSVTREKYEKCGWERSKINVRNGKIYNCPSAEFAELFNDYFGLNLKITSDDFLDIDASLTRERIDMFRKEVPFCGQCDIDRRYKQVIPNAPSERKITEWSCLGEVIKDKGV